MAIQNLCLALGGFGVVMTERFDLFQVDNEGVLWIGTANSLEECRSLAKGLSGDCDFRVVDQTTGEILELPRTGLRGPQG